MQSVFIILLTLITVVVLLQRKLEIGHAMLAGSVVLTVTTLSTPVLFFESVVKTGRHSNTWEILIALYFVMCLEYQLRTSGLLDKVMAAARRKLISDKFLLAGMPAFLGFLPSLGGALFSAPMVENASRRYDMTPEQKTAVNYWFRHIWEYVNPIMPGLLLTGQITRIPLPDLIQAMSIFVLAAIVIGWFVCLAGIREKTEIFAGEGEEAEVPVIGSRTASTGLNPILWTAGPILFNIFLVVFFHLAASVSMAIVVLLMVLVLRQNAADIKVMLRHGLDRKLLWGIASILLFQQVLHDTGVLDGVVKMLETYGISALIVAGVLAFVGGILTGTSGGFVALSMPVIVAMSPEDIVAVSIGFVMGTAGQMLSPMHLCLLVSLRYFGADFSRSMVPVAIMQTLMFGVLFLRYGVF